MACASVLLGPWILSVKMWGVCGKHIEIPDADTTIFFIPRMSIISVILDDGKAQTLPLSYAHIACQLPNCVSHGEARDTLIANQQHSACMLERGWRRCRNQHNQLLPIHEGLKSNTCCTVAVWNILYSNVTHWRASICPHKAAAAGVSKLMPTCPVRVQVPEYGFQDGCCRS